ncbi:Disulfide-bond oxidoreductase YghU (GSH-dependent disulfide-bond oxidoreductase YghU) (GST N2-2) (Organic hydroperoxidase) [Durusdinium trenchii]|uniref:Disulfide-bond oxidoreductase YghU (GSH-dependent disulfide-bond oxidoreductase YghU) (GST N2-2) (Organic hydroperoxidase) n=1 Tax=Durusdinium trenchii TaxID=1381693 RepID=A0ABP0HNV8_9DINO
MALEEAGLAFDAHLINIMSGDQFTSGFSEINPNQKIPALVDLDGPGGSRVNVFESGAILLYIAEKTGTLIPKDPVKRVDCLNWLFWLQGSAPYFGQFGHFFKYAAPKWSDGYAVERYTMETKRLLDVLNNKLKGKNFICGDEYTIADIAIYPWVMCLDKFYNARELLGLDDYKHVCAWLDRVDARPSTKLGMRINNFNNDEYSNYTSKGSQ